MAEDEGLDALEALESEAKEFDKVHSSRPSTVEKNTKSSGRTQKSIASSKPSA